MKTINYIKIIFFVCISISSSAQDKNNLDSIFNRWQNAHEAKPGIAVGIIKDGQTYYKKTFGYANLEYKIPLNSNSIFDMASIAKQFTGFAVAKLITEQKISLEDPVINYIPELKGLGEIGEAIKIKHLVSHTSGLRDVVDIFDFAQFGNNLTTEKALQIISRQKDLNFTTGSRYAYSNTNYVLLALILERTEGKTFREWCHENIFMPLQMNSTFINDNPKKIIENRAVAYYSNERGYSFEQNNGMSLIGSSSLYSSIDDMLKWAMALASEEKFKKIFQLMKTTGITNNGEQINYGFGLSIGEYNSMYEITHNGSTSAGFRTLITWLPQERIAIILLSNLGDLNDLFGEFGTKIMEKLIPSKSNLEKGDQNQAETNHESISLNIEDLDKFTGNFLMDFQQKLKIERIGTQLKILPEGHGSFDIFPMNKETLYFPAFQAKFKFDKSSHGTYNKATVYNGKNKVGKLQRLKAEDLNQLNSDVYTGNYYSDEFDMYIKITESDNTLSIKNPKFGNMQLHERTNKIFIPVEPLASNIIFNADKEGVMNTFLLNNGNRLMNVKFVRVQ